MAMFSMRQLFKRLARKRRQRLRDQPEDDAALEDAERTDQARVYDDDFAEALAKRDEEDRRRREIRRHEMYVLNMSSGRASEDSILPGANLETILLGQYWSFNSCVRDPVVIEDDQ
jgi:hypothetical protein